MKDYMNDIKEIVAMECEKSKEDINQAGVSVEDFRKQAMELCGISSRDDRVDAAKYLAMHFKNPPIIEGSLPKTLTTENIEKHLKSYVDEREHNAKYLGDAAGMKHQEYGKVIARGKEQSEEAIKSIYGNAIKDLDEGTRREFKKALEMPGEIREFSEPDIRDLNRPYRERRIGRFRISLERILDSPFGHGLIYKVMEYLECIPVKTEHEYYTKSFAYVGYSKHFEKTQEGDEAPTYYIKINQDINKNISFDVEKMY